MEVFYLSDKYKMKLEENFLLKSRLLVYWTEKIWNMSNMNDINEINNA